MGLVKNRWRKPAWRRWTPLLWICPFLVVSAVFVLVDGFSVHETAPAPEIAGEDCEVVGDEHELLVTGYCNCGKCCQCGSVASSNVADFQSGIEIGVGMAWGGLVWYTTLRKETEMATKCRHCGSTSYGHGCAYGPDRLHEHRDDEKHCEWCGSSSYGHGCAYGPNRVHRHGPGGNKCIWCGSTSNGAGCPYSPTRRHEK